MLNYSNYDPNENLPSPSVDAANLMLNSPSIFEFNATSTPPGVNPSYNNSSSSPPLTIISEPVLFKESRYNSYTNHSQSDLSFYHLGTTVPNTDDAKVTVINRECKIEQPNVYIAPIGSSIPDDEKLVILAEPKAIYRERYSCETDSTKHRAQRYIRAESGELHYEYPTVKIPQKWCDPTRSIYIRVSSITITSETVPYHCIHPYPIETGEVNVMRDPETNSLYFPLTERDCKRGEKSFQISRKKMIQNHLRSYGPFRLFSSNQPDVQRISDSHDAKHKICMYQLWKSQLVFTIAVKYNSAHFPDCTFRTSVMSQVMTDGVTERRVTVENCLRHCSSNPIKCVPQKSDWNGGDEVVIIMPTAVKGKSYRIYFDFGIAGLQNVNEIVAVDTKTILFVSPLCPMLPGDENIKVSIVVTENGFVHSPIDFYYVPPVKINLTFSSSYPNALNAARSNYKRPFELDGCSEEDLVSQIKELSIQKESSESSDRVSANEKSPKIDKYLNQLKVALDVFLRTNDPSRLFRRTRILLSTSDTNPPPLHDAIQNGHRSLALLLIKQVFDMDPSKGLLEKVNENGETPLLVAATHNEWILIEAILKNRCDLADQKDKNGNNILHILAKLHDDQGACTIENVLEILSSNIKRQLLLGKNQLSQMPTDSAQSHNNNISAERLKSSYHIR